MYKLPDAIVLADKCLEGEISVIGAMNEVHKSLVEGGQISDGENYHSTHVASTLVAMAGIGGHNGHPINWHREVLASEDVTPDSDVYRVLQDCSFVLREMMQTPQWQERVASHV